MPTAHKTRAATASSVRITEMHETISRTIAAAWTLRYICFARFAS